MKPSHVLLALAIVFEVVGTSSLKATENFTRLLPSVLVLGAYSCSFWLLTLSLKEIPIGVAYATWSGVGIVLIASAAFLIYGQRLDAPALLGMGFIVVGVVLMNAFSRVEIH